MSASQIFHSAGRRQLNQIFNGGASRPPTLYVGLRQLDGAGGHPTDAAAADTLTSNLQEVSGSGYARQSLTNNTTQVPEAASGADSKLSLAAVTFSFTGTVTGITHAFICTSSDNSGVLICSEPLPVTRNVASGDTLAESLTITLTQG